MRYICSLQGSDHPGVAALAPQNYSYCIRIGRNGTFSYTTSCKLNVTNTKQGSSGWAINHKIGHLNSGGMAYSPSVYFDKEEMALYFGKKAP